MDETQRLLYGIVPGFGAGAYGAPADLRAGYGRYDCRESFEDNFDGKGIDADKWVTSGDGVGQNVLAGS